MNFIVSTNIYVLVFFVFLLPSIFIAISMKNYTPVKLMFTSIIYIIYTVFITGMMIMENISGGDQTMALVGRVLLTISSIIGGTLFSTAWKELREASKSKEQEESVK